MNRCVGNTPEDSDDAGANSQEKEIASLGSCRRKSRHNEVQRGFRLVLQDLLSSPVLCAESTLMALYQRCLMSHAKPLVPSIRFIISCTQEAAEVDGILVKIQKAKRDASVKTLTVYGPTVRPPYGTTLCTKVFIWSEGYKAKTLLAAKRSMYIQKVNFITTAFTEGELGSSAVYAEQIKPKPNKLTPCSNITELRQRCWKHFQLEHLERKENDLLASDE